MVAGTDIEPWPDGDVFALETFAPASGFAPLYSSLMARVGFFAGADVGDGPILRGRASHRVLVRDEWAPQIGACRSREAW